MPIIKCFPFIVTKCLHFHIYDMYLVFMCTFIIIFIIFYSMFMYILLYYVYYVQIPLYFICLSIKYHQCTFFLSFFIYFLTLLDTSKSRYHNIVTCLIICASTARSHPALFWTLRHTSCFDYS